MGLIKLAVLGGGVAYLARTMDKSVEKYQERKSQDDGKICQPQNGTYQQQYQYPPQNGTYQQQYQHTPQDGTYPQQYQCPAPTTRSEPPQYQHECPPAFQSQPPPYDSSSRDCREKRK